jgi:hypothetical protein
MTTHDQLTVFTEKQRRILISIMIPVVFSLICLFILGIYNIYMVLYRQKKYKTLLIFILYVIAMTDILCAIGQSVTIFSEDYCDDFNVIPSYLHSFTNLALGICQTAIILEVSLAIKRLITRSQMSSE